MQNKNYFDSVYVITNYSLITLLYLCCIYTQANQELSEVTRSID